MGDWMTPGNVSKVSNFRYLTAQACPISRSLEHQDEKFHSGHTHVYLDKPASSANLEVKSGVFDTMHHAVDHSRRADAA